MRLLILAAAATLLVTGTAMADESDGTSARHHHYREANASVPNAYVPDGSAPADTLSAHETHIKNLHDSGYNPASDFNAAGNVQTNW
jgi:hypothetical protein